jgi:hypothetical protein
MERIIQKEQWAGYTVYIPAIIKKKFLFWNETLYFASNKLHGFPRVYFFTKQEAQEFLSNN